MIEHRKILLCGSGTHKAYIDDHHIGAVQDCSVLGIGAVAGLALLKTEEDFSLIDFGEIELGRVEVLEDLVHPELCGSLLEMPSFIELSDKPVVARKKLP